MCSVNKGDLPIQIWWSFYDVHFKLDRNLSNNDGVMMTKTGNKASVLTIESAQPRHRGNYTCYAQNKGGVAQYSAYLSINGDFKASFKQTKPCTNLQKSSKFCNLYQNISFLSSNLSFASDRTVQLRRR